MQGISQLTEELFVASGLHDELQKVVSNAYGTIEGIDRASTFLSWNNIVDLLTELPYNQNDTVYVVSRNDHAAGFWTQRRKEVYLGYLKANAIASGGFTNQTRIMVYDDSRIGRSAVAMSGDEMPAGDIYHDLMVLHKPKTYYSFPSSRLSSYHKIAELRFGFTLSKTRQFAIIAVPAGIGIDSTEVARLCFGEILQGCEDYEAADGPMKAIVTVNPEYVEGLAREVEALLGDTGAYPLK